MEPYPTTLVVEVAKAESDPSRVFDEPVGAFGAGIGDPSLDEAEDLGPARVDRLSEPARLRHVREQTPRRVSGAAGRDRGPVGGGQQLAQQLLDAPVRSAEYEDIPRLRDLTTARQTWLDNEQDATETTTNPAEVGARFGARWAAHAAPKQLAALLELRPQAPRHLDGELPHYAERSGIDTWEDEVAKLAVRDGF